MAYRNSIEDLSVQGGGPITARPGPHDWRVETVIARSGDRWKLIFSALSDAGAATELTSNTYWSETRAACEALAETLASKLGRHTA